MERIAAMPEIYILLFGFLFNFVWEISHMPYYQGFYDFLNRDRTVTRRYWFGENTFAMRRTFAGVFWFASACDALLVLFHYWLVSLLLWDRYWIIDGGVLPGAPGIAVSRWEGYGLAILSGLIVQFAIEALALRRGWWGYSGEMPMIGKRCALLPNIQMALPVFLSCVLTRLVILGLNA